MSTTSLRSLRLCLFRRTLAQSSTLSSTTLALPQTRNRLLCTLRATPFSSTASSTTFALRTSLLQTHLWKAAQTQIQTQIRTRGMKVRSSVKKLCDGCK
ncbi:MAG: hypothetical protein Q9228_004470, partial [Teloschistes exilis]